VLLHPDRVVAAFLRSGVPLLKPNAERASIKAHDLADAALQLSVLCNLRTKEGVSVRDGPFAGVWLANEVFWQSCAAKRLDLCRGRSALSTPRCCRASG
jgi:hypothetical protein